VLCTIGKTRTDEAKRKALRKKKEKSNNRNRGGKAMNVTTAVDVSV
jgi:hypothetical protein